jgi:hypothetical protein
VHRPDIDLPSSCTSCGAGITGPPVVRSGLPYCCAGCLAGRQCACVAAVPANARVRECLDVSGPFDMPDPRPPRRTGRLAASPSPAGRHERQIQAGRMARIAEPGSGRRAVRA